MSVSNGEHVTLVHKDGRAIGDGDTIQLGVVGLTQRNNVDLNNKDDKQYTTTSICLRTHRSVGDLDLELGVLFADNRKLDPDVATLGPPEQAFLEKFNFE